MSKTPKTDALRLKMAQLGWPPDAEPVAMIMSSHSELERELDFSEQTGRQIWKANERLKSELAAITGEEGELWELRQANARMKDNLASLSHLHAKEAEKWQASYEAERALADRLAHWLTSLESEDLVPAEWSTSVANAIRAWKEARRE